MSKLFGYFTYSQAEKPEYDPGLEVNCIFCAKPLSAPMKTISLMTEGSFRSYFYRCHKDCYENLDSDELMQYESLCVDSKEDLL